MVTIQIRRGTTTQWATQNPVLGQGEPGIELVSGAPNGKWKIGDGATAWSALPYFSDGSGLPPGGSAGDYLRKAGPQDFFWLPATAGQVRDDLGIKDAATAYFGTGEDGNVSLTTGTTTLTRDMYYANLTISGTAKIITNGYRIFVKGTLDISAAGFQAIQCLGTPGNDASGSTPATAPAVQASQTIAQGQQGGDGGASSIGSGSAAPSVAAASPANGGQAGGGAAGGSGGGGAGGGTVTSSAPSNPMSLFAFARELVRGVSLILGGSGGVGGSGAGGDGSSNSGGAGGSGGNGGGVVFISAGTIARAGATSAAAISAAGGAGGDGGLAPATNCGGGGGAGAGAGGWVVVFYGLLTGTTATNCLDAAGATGGDGGAGSGTGDGGNGGDGSAGGRITLINVIQNTGAELIGAAGTGGSVAFGNTPGNGGAGGAAQMDL